MPVELTSITTHQVHGACPVEVPFVISNIPKYQYTIKRSEQFAAGAIITVDKFKTVPYSQNKM
jgi:hypothetical protein